ncbi:hypothetical protein P5673_001278 [Acropora cervicornis]|uniref:Uncharacterized protein n=1 Tax=Acropora cervicornis TaxID=6130 RepID=A0AAD9R5M6_ACRCE|nr:hypothetical protein P5673_001278 [Acropora cervicornis]
MGEAAAHSASALANRALPIHEPTKPSLGLSLRKALEIIQPLNCTVGLPAFPRSFSSSMGSEEKGCELPLLMHRDCDNLRDSGAGHEPEVGSVSRNLLSDVLGSDSLAHESSSEFRIFPSLSEINDINSNEISESGSSACHGSELADAVPTLDTKSLTVSQRTLPRTKKRKDPLKANYNIELTGVSRVSIDELLDADNGRWVFQTISEQCNEASPDSSKFIYILEDD